MSLLNVSGVSKEGKDFQLKGISFEQHPNQKLAVAGATGSGKSTLLHIIAGLDQADVGTIYFDGERVKGPYEKLMPGHPGIVYLSQYFELRHHYTVEEILAYANQLTDNDADNLYKVCRINHLLNRKTDQLSGGEQQRVALARLLSTAPKLLLLDEPFSNLDLIHKKILKSVIDDICEKLNITCILVSHDPVDTLSWADEILVMKEGVIVQQGRPEHIYLQPNDEYVAALFGSYNLLSREQIEAFAGLPIKDNSDKYIVRPEHFEITKEGSGVSSRIDKIKFFGSYYELEVTLSNAPVLVRTNVAGFSKGETIWLTVSDKKAWPV